jgi:flagellar hook assembly protein FlgD
VNGKVTINVYNQIGQLVKTLVDGNQNAGDYSIRMDANNLMPGIYIAKLSLTNTGVDLSGTLKLSVLK